MILFVAWLMFAIELGVAVTFGVIFWKLWSRSAVKRSVAMLALTVYAVCCALCLMITFFVPL